MADIIKTDLGEKLTKALSNKDEKEALVWKGKNGEDINLTDMSYEELQRVYTHTMDMLYNTSRFVPGRYQVKKNIKNFVINCNAELFKRYILHESGQTILTTVMQIIEYLRIKKHDENLDENMSVTTVFNNIPQEYSTVTIGELMNSCFDKLESINKKMISDKFILSQGLWLTDDEKAELTEYLEDGSKRNWMDVIRERLVLNNVKLRVDPRGLSYTEFRALVQLPKLSKISELPTKTLRLLRDKIFLALDADVDYHINKWTNILKNIESVAKQKGFELKSKNY